MQLRDTSDGYGLVSRMFHWLMALAIVVMFALGLWMVGLDYYSPHYHSAPSLHKSVGILLMIALALRFGWRLLSVQPDDRDLTRFERSAAHVVHWGFYPLLFALLASGYLISTADGRPIEVFGLFNVPSPGENKGLEDTAGAVHTWLAYAVIALAVVHAAAAIKHHLFDGGRSFSRMWTGPRKI